MVYETVCKLADGTVGTAKGGQFHVGDLVLVIYQDENGVYTHTTGVIVEVLEYRVV